MVDDVEKDLKLMVINRWKAIVTDRFNWRMISESALSEKGYSAYEEEKNRLVNAGNESSFKNHLCCHEYPTKCRLICKSLY
ncbi:hypothetical protein TNIN_497811 [Trichonephila inaurata madagascariensis]|uniref:Uncharacterized protein n=1 Tax=Trichonephila inaurata madagascariensis TaxID=2747483 RepID=A0A8X6XNZ0_9ARAC|nr:hypothetical protein TNIN_497811 [Trichonephila inaurata madagascariensis]